MSHLKVSRLLKVTGRLALLVPLSASLALLSPAPAQAQEEEVEEKDKDVIIAEVETVDGSLVEQFSIDRYTGRMQRSH